MSAEPEFIDLHACRARWGQGYKVTYDVNEKLTEIIDGNGIVVPQEDWEAFQAYQRAVFDDQMAAAIDHARLHRGRPIS